MKIIKHAVEAKQILSNINNTYSVYSEQTKDEQEFLASLILKYKPKKILEIGISAGSSSAIILSAMQKYIHDDENKIRPHLYSIDYSTAWYRDKKKKTGFIMDVYPDLMKDWTLYTGSLACNFIETIGPDIDFVFIDTVHYVPGEILDFLIVYPYLKNNCIVVFHDTNMHTTRIASGLRSPDAFVNNILVSSISGEIIIPEYAKNFYSENCEGEFPYYKTFIKTNTFEDLRTKIVDLKKGTIIKDRNIESDENLCVTTKILNYCYKKINRSRRLKKLAKKLGLFQSRVEAIAEQKREKIIDESPLEIPFPNMTAIVLDKSDESSIWKVFNLLTMPWFTSPSDKDFQDLDSFIKRHYDKIYYDMYRTSVNWARCLKKTKKLAPEKAMHRLYEIPKHVRFVHLLFNDKFIPPLVNLLNNNFNKDEHIFLCKRTFKHLPFPVGENVIEVTSYDDFDYSANNIEKIIAHSYCDHLLVNYLYKNKKILQQKLYWLVWGGDLYFPPEDIANTYVRKNCKGYLPGLDGDIVKEKYGIEKYIHPTSVLYTFPVNIELLDSIKQSPKNELRIQINNSSDISTLEVLTALTKFKNENIKVITILSYGNLAVKDEIIAKGQLLFGAKFEYIEEMLSPYDYAKHLMQNDILILAQNRQQGFGNTLASLYLEKKVFIKSQISVYKYLNKSNIKVYDSNEIANLTFNEFITNPEKAKNKSLMLALFDEKAVAKNWSTLFEKKEI